MAQKLSSWDRAQRQRERERERERAADSRARERARASRERESERRHVRAERESERAQVRREREREAARKVRAKNDQVAAWRDEVEQAGAYLVGLGRLHAGLPPLARASADLEALLEERTYTPNRFIPAPFGEPLLPRAFTPAPFDPHPGSLGAAYAVAVAACVLGAVVAIEHAVVGVLVCAAGAGAAIALGAWLSAAHGRAEAERLRVHEVAVAEQEARVIAENHFARQLWEGRRRRHDATEAARRAFFDAREARNLELFEEREDERLDVLSDAKGGSPTALSLVIEALLPLELELDAPPDEYVDAPFDPSELEIAYAIEPDGIARVALLAPGIEVVPTRESEMTPSGERIKYKALPEKRRVQVWREHVESLALAQAVAIFGAAPALGVIELEVWSDAVDAATGSTTPCCLLGTRIPRAALEAVDLSAAVASAVFTRIGCRRGDRVASGRGRLERGIPEADLTWAKPEDEQPYLPRGLIRGQTSPALPNEFAPRDPAWELPDAVRAAGSIGAALGQVRPGGEVLLPDGRYPEHLVVKWPVTLRAEHPGNVELVAADDDAITCRTLGFVARGLVIRCTSTPGDAVYLLRGGAELHGCTVTGAGHGLNLAESWATVVGGKLTGAGLHGVHVGRRSQAWLGAAEVTGNGRAGVLVRDHGRADIRDSRVAENGYEGVWAQSGARVTLATTDLRGNRRGAMDIEDGATLERGEGVVI